MKRFIKLSTAAAAFLLAGQSPAHEVPNIEHTHAFKQTAYGTYRQGHSVNGPNGSIIIWSPRQYGGYRSAPNVRFARPEPITKAPGSVGPASKTTDSARDYGKQQEDDYGN